jgi:hypothetical protein
MRDYLEDNVDDKYYLTSDKAKALIDQLLEDGTLLRSIAGGGTSSVILRNLGSSDENRTPGARETDVSATLLSRDYKGLSNYGSNGVIECERIGFH